MRHLRIHSNKTFLFFTFLLLFLVSGCSQPVHHGLTEEQANDMLIALDRNGIHGTKVTEEGGEVLAFTVTVPKSDAANAWLILRDNGLPRPPKKGFDEVYGKTSLIPTAAEEKAMFLQALMGEISRTIEAINGVIDARVHVVLPETDVLKEAIQGQTVPKAAVLIKYKVDQNGTLPFKADDIRRLVANSVEGLKPDDVTIVATEVYPDKKPQLLYFGPLKIAHDSLGYLKIFIIVLVALFLFVGIMLILAARTTMSLKKELNQIRSLGYTNQSQLPDTTEN